MFALSFRTLATNIQRIWQRWTNDNGSLLAAGVAYYGALSFFPLLLTLISGVGLLLKFTAAGKNAETELLNAIGLQLSPELQVHMATDLARGRGWIQSARSNRGGPVLPPVVKLLNWKDRRWKPELLACRMLARAHCLTP